MTPNFSVMGDKIFMTSGKLGNGLYDQMVGYSISQIEDALSKSRKAKGIVKANITSKRGSDFNNCWKSLDIDNNLGLQLLEKLKLTWHHMDDLNLDLKSSLQLVITKIHQKTTNHIGSHKQIEEL